MVNPKSRKVTSLWQRIWNAQEKRHKELTGDAQMALEGWLKRVQPQSIVEGEPPHFGRIQAVMADRVIEQMEKAPKREPVKA